MLLISLLFAMTLARSDEFHVVNRGTISVEKPAFLTLSGSWLMISSFKLFGLDHVFYLPAKGEIVQNRSSVNSFTDKVVWPNEVLPVSASEMGREGYLIPSGFLLPTKSTGAVSFVDQITGAVTKLTRDKKGFFYHRASLVDLSKTGRLDILTARGKISPFGSHDGELIWLKRPSNPIGGEWSEVILAKGPDIHFRVLKSSDSNFTYIVAAEFSNKQLKLLWVAKDGSVGSRIIDSTLGHPFDVDFADLNHDGRVDMLVTNHEGDSKASVFAYEIPSNLQNGSWTRHTLLEGIQTRQKGFNQASPGVAKAFYPDTKKTDSKPWILVSGDGSQRVHLLSPLSEETYQWTYKEDVILDTKSTVGEPLIYDFDGDGLSDFVIPAYDADMLYLMSIKR